MKKKLLKTIAISMASIMLLAACGTSDKAGESTNGEEGKETLRVVTNAAYAPMEYLDKGEPVGFDIDLIQAVAEQAGYEIKVEHLGWDPVFVETESKRADLAIAAITIDETRKQTYDFSVPYFQSTNKILIPEGSEITTAEDLKGKKVAVQNGTTGQAAVDELLGKNHQDIKKFEDNNLAIMELESGGADAVVADNVVIEEYAKNNPEKKLKVIEDDAFESVYLGIMFPKGSELKADFDKALNEVFDNGTYTEIYQEWFGIEPNIDILKEQQE